MSKALASTGDLAISSHPGNQQKGGSAVKSNTSGKSNLMSQSAHLQGQKLPRGAHRHHRKPESNLNHLLNFSYARPAAGAAGSLPLRRNARTTPSYGRGSGYHPLDKAHFVNANYRFVVHPSGDYRPNLIESDIPVPWENVLQVLASVQSQCNACPICLEAVPVAPRMAKCGHVFCLPCALRYLDSEDVKTGKTTGKWRKCPICFDGIYAHELRSVRWFSGDDMLPEKGSDVTLQLIRRNAGSMFALPRDSDSIQDDVVPWHNRSDALEYARLVKGDAAYMSAQAEREVHDLLIMKEQDEQAFGDEDQWTAKSIDVIETYSTVHCSLGLAPRQETLSSARRKTSRPPIEYSPAAGPHEFQAEAATISRRPIVTGLKRGDVVEDGLESASGDAYYFYQPRTGSHYYLSALDIRVLKKAFTSFAEFPSALIAKVEHATTVSVDDDLRRRSKYLSHLPLGCEVTFLECDWSGVLSDDIVSAFKVEVDKRRKKRHDKAVSEETARRRAQAADERRERQGLGEMQWRDEDTSYFARNDESNTYEIFAEDPLPSNVSATSSSLPTGSLERLSIWGTALPVGNEQVVVPEDDEWKEQLEKFYQDSAVSNSLEETTASGKKTKSKKKKLVLMSSGGGRGTG